MNAATLGPSRTAAIVAGAALAAVACGRAAPPGGAELPDLPGAQLTPSPAPPVEAKLLADVAAVQPGRAFRLGVLLTIQPGWHVYWKNPGDGGIACSVEFRLPEGFRARPLQWPTPETFRSEGGGATYGYGKSVLLWAAVRPPEQLPADGQVRLRADAGWMACRTMCVLGDAGLELVLPVAAGERPANRELFDVWAGRLPLAVAAAGCLEAVGVSGSIPPGESAGQFTIAARWKGPPTAVEWCPAAPDGLAVEKVSIETLGAETRVAFTARRLAGPKPPPVALETVLVRAEGGDPPRRQGILVHVPLTSTRASASSQPAKAPPADTE